MDLDENSKLDTVLLLDADVADLFADLSQYETDLADHGTYFDETASARTAVAAPRDIVVIFDMATGNSGTLVDHSNGVTIGYRIEVVAGAVRCVEGGTIRTAASPLGIIATPRKILAAWSQFPNGTSTQSVLVLYNFATGEWVHAPDATHASTTPNPSHTLTIKARSGGSSPYPNTLHQVRIGRRFHSQTETSEDWVALTSPGVTLGARRVEGTPIDRTTEIGSEGSFTGPAVLATGRSTEADALRLSSPLVNEQVRSPLTLRNTYTPARWHRPGWAGAPESRMLLSTIFLREVPPNVSEVFVRVHVLHYTAGAAIVPVYLRAFSFDGYSDPEAFCTDEGTVIADHGVGGAGEWVTLGPLPVARDPKGQSRFCLGYNFNHDVAAAGLTDTRLLIRAFTVEALPK
ncbi:hypothetical protein OV203_02410 [Nannocystis sp. ILAH1]|uniref:hypothetical protein n=1 Tax=Nannocystis sp. ILAH1 TaxID=2996789 RepID=UPI002270A2BE|nr:hypothetical protein [Nannocystis sp. ILAH1]MCY0985964.1 hypothetical protein [Nannocystis sp. ILAH1]